MAVLAVILAAGMGSRLRPITDATPKCLIDIAGRPMLGRLLDALTAAGVPRVVIVTGHLSHRIAEYVRREHPVLDVTFVENAAFATTQNAASLAAARSAIGGDAFLLCDSDVVFSASPFPALLGVAEACALSVDGSAPFNAEAMKIALDRDGRITRMSKQLGETASAGESIGIQKVGGEALPLLWELLESIVGRRAADAYYEDAFQQLIERGIRFGTSPVAPGSWVEIDDAADLADARRLFGETAR